MEQIRKIAKTINQYFGFLKFITIALTILLTLAVIWIIFMLNETSMLFNVISTISLSWITMDFNSSLFPNLLSMKIFFILSLIIFYIAVLIFIELIKIIRNILNNMIEETIFKNEMANQIMDLSKLFFIYGIYNNIASFIIYRFYLDYTNLKTLLLAGNVSNVTTKFTFDFNFILLSAVIYLLSYIFRYGAQLQQLSDETL